MSELPVAQRVAALRDALAALSTLSTIAEAKRGSVEETAWIVARALLTAWEQEERSREDMLRRLGMGQDGP
jgi:hypothetical protein